MLRRIAAVVVPFAVIVGCWLPTRAQAQDTPTDPPNILLRCHGYHEAGGKTRRYDCVPNPRDNERMKTFLPAVGSPCDEGRVWEGVQPRIFQIKCREGAPTGVTDITIRNVRRYDSSIDIADWLYFDIVSHRSLPRFTLEVRFHYEDGTFLRCSERVDASVAGEVQEGLVIPDVCGSDVQWERASILAPSGMTCTGCGTYNRTFAPATSSISATAPDSALEFERLLADYRLRHAEPR